MAPHADNFFTLIEARSDIDGRFINLRRAGEGHFCLVFSATDKTSNSEVAVKVFHIAFLNDTYRLQCFRRESEILERLKDNDHILDWIAPVRDFTVTLVEPTTNIPIDLRFPYFALELAVGDVGQVIRSGSWKPEQTLLAFREMCKAVQRIHRESVCHRDIKPSNFVVMKDGGLKLSDFGTARDFKGSEPPILSNYPWPPGDVRYTSPEMLAVIHDVQPSIAFLGDFYSLGATLFEMCTGLVLGIQIFDAAFMADLAKSMNAVDRSRRLHTYLGFVRNLAGAHPLPSIAAFGHGLPLCVATLVDDLYQSMVALDFRDRLCDFERIFLRIERCLLVLRNDEKIRRWRERREIFKRNREEKYRRAEARMLSLRTGVLR
jgi:serine/threonine protein kinase